MEYKKEFTKDIDINTKSTISIIDEINKRMKIVLDKQIKQTNNNKNVKYIIPKEVFNEKQIYDEIRYYVKVDSNSKVNKVEYIGKSIENKDSLKSYGNYKKILIIVESPHRNEFTFSYEPKGPAQGKTGYGIETKIDEIIKELGIISEELLVVISNPVQFQASLGTFYSNGLDKRIRDNLWTKLYDENDYLNRIKDIDAKYIINATTSRRTDRINRVIEKYKNIGSNNPIIEVANHPSCWVGKEIGWRK